jgi:hypothetical protein
MVGYGKKRRKVCEKDGKKLVRYGKISYFNYFATEVKRTMRSITLNTCSNTNVHLYLSSGTTKLYPLSFVCK